MNISGLGSRNGFVLPSLFTLPLMTPSLMLFKCVDYIISTIISTGIPAPGRITTRTAPAWEEPSILQPQRHRIWFRTNLMMVTRLIHITALTCGGPNPGMSRRTRSSNTERGPRQKPRPIVITVGATGPRGRISLLQPGTVSKSRHESYIVIRRSLHKSGMAAPRL